MHSSEAIEVNNSVVPYRTLLIERGPIGVCFRTLLSYQKGNIFMVRDTELTIISHHHTNSDAQLVGTYHNAPE